MLWRLVLAGLMFAAALPQVNAIATGDGVSVFEYVVGIVLAVALLQFTFLPARSASRGPANPRRTGRRAERSMELSD